MGTQKHSEVQNVLQCQSLHNQRPALPMQKNTGDLFLKVTAILAQVFAGRLSHTFLSLEGRLSPNASSAPASAKRIKRPLNYGREFIIGKNTRKIKNFLIPPIVQFKRYRKKQNHSISYI